MVAMNGKCVLKTKWICNVLGLFAGLVLLESASFGADASGGSIVDNVRAAGGGRISLKFCSSASGSPGYMPQCSKIDTSSCTVTALGTGKEKSPDSNGDCTAGQLKVQRFNASAERETVCLDVSACGSNVALCQRWSENDKTVRYSCVTNSAIQLGL